MGKHDSRHELKVVMQSLKAAIDAEPSIFKPSGDPTLQSDGYLPTAVIENLVSGSRTLIDNPSPASQIPKPFRLIDLEMAAPTGLTALDIPTIIEIGARERAQDREGLAALFRIIQSKIPTDEAAAVQSLLTATMPDPTWPAKVQGPSILEAIGWSGDHREIATLINKALSRPS